MGDRHTINLECFYCEWENKNIYYAPSSEYTTFACEKCNEKNEIRQEFIAYPIDDAVNNK